MPAIWAAGIGAAASLYAASNAQDDANSSNKAAMDSAERQAAERLKFDKEIFTSGKEDRDFARGMAQQQAGIQAADRVRYQALEDEQIARGRKYDAEADKMLGEAQDYDTPEKREAAAAAAMADVNAGFSTARGQNERAMSRSGVNVSSGKAMALGNETALRQATGLAGAANGARKQTELQGYARKMDAIGLGKGIIGNQATQAGLALNSGNSAVSNAIAGSKVNDYANGQMSNAYGNAGASAMSLATAQSKNFYDANKYASGVGKDVGGMPGSLATKYSGPIANSFGYGSSGNNYAGSSSNVSAPNYTNAMDMGYIP